MNVERSLNVIDKSEIDALNFRSSICIQRNFVWINTPKKFILPFCFLEKLVKP